MVRRAAPHSVSALFIYRPRDKSRNTRTNKCEKSYVGIRTLVKIWSLANDDASENDVAP